MLTPLVSMLFVSSLPLGGPVGAGEGICGGRHQHPAPVERFEVVGSVELSPSEARRVAIEQARTRATAALARRIDGLVARSRPIWMPEFVADRATRHAREATDLAIVVVDHETIEREHSFGRSYQTRLVVELDPDGLRQSESLAARALGRAKRVFPIQLGSIAGLWALLALLVGWFDRLSRGYMTGRLRWIGVLLGLSIPAAILMA